MSGGCLGFLNHQRYVACIFVGRILENSPMDVEESFRPGWVRVGGTGKLPSNLKRYEKKLNGT